MSTDADAADRRRVGRPGLPGQPGSWPYAEPSWRKRYAAGGRCVGACRRVGDRRADVRQQAPGQWSVTVVDLVLVPVRRPPGTRWMNTGEPVELGTWPGRKAAQAAADEALGDRAGTAGES